MTPDELCTQCASLTNSIFSKQLPVGQQCDHHNTFAELDNSAISCRLCALFRRNVMLRVYFEDGVWPEGEEKLKLMGTDNGRRRQLPSLAQARGSTIEIKCGRRKAVTCHYALDLHGAYCARNRVFIYSPNEQHIWPPQSVYELAREWIGTCTSTHNCSERLSKPCDTLGNASNESKEYSNAPMSLLPSRVIDVGEAGPNVKIVVPDTQTRGHYLALSYCWGQGPHKYVTTRTNFHRRMELLPLDSLPLTIRDAIEITRNLHVRYLWVDACCIVQPTPEDPDLSDWQREAPKMVDVYGGALCTIAPANAKGCNEGCFSGRQALSIPAEEVVISSHPSKSQLVFTKGFLPWVCASSGPLDHRAWVLQESLISPRTLYWTNYGLFWGCKEFHFSESQPTEDAEGFEDVRPPLDQEKMLSKSGAYA